MNGDADVADPRALGFSAELKEQRWDDHRLYHHSRINQSLHLVERAELPDGLRAARPCIPASQRSSAGSSRCGRGRSATSSSSRRTSTRSISSRTRARKRSRSATTCGARSCCSTIWALSPLAAVARSGARRACSTPHTDLAAASSTTSPSCGSCSAPAGLLFRTVQLFFIRSVQTGPRLVHEDPDGPVSRRAALPQVAAATCCAASSSIP